MSEGQVRGLIAVIRVSDPVTAEVIARGLAATSVDLIEITLTIPSAVEVIGALVDDGLRGRIGAGTVRTPEQVERAVAAGAAFLVSPHSDPKLIAQAGDGGVPYVAGALTPSEIAAAIAAGASAAKVFPVGSVGGQEYVRLLREPFPDVALVASGGISPETARGYFEAGCDAVCLGRGLWAGCGSMDDPDSIAREVSGVLDRAGLACTF